LYPAAYSEVFNETFGPVSHHAIGIAFRLQQCQLTKDQLQALGRQHKTAAELYRALKEQAKGGQALTSTECTYFLRTTNVSGRITAIP
jgi:hypothetical protein